jgi:hypothetical protein
LRYSGVMNPTHLILLSVMTLAATAFAVDPPPDGGYPNGNTAEGQDALFSLTTGSSNVAIGLNSLYFNTTGSANTATGGNALFNNTMGAFNTAAGDSALLANTTGVFNTAMGATALISNTMGSNNTAIGLTALHSNTTGNNNIGVGLSAGFNLTTGNNNIDIGNSGVADESGTIRIGTARDQRTTFIAGIATSPLATGTAVAVGITPTGQLGVRASSARFKEEIKPMDKASEAILSLRPVTFRYKKGLDSEGLPQFGLVAEEVAKVDPDLVLSDADGKLLTVRYDEINAMLLNEFLKEHRKVEEQECKLAEQDRKGQEQDATITQLKSAIAQQRNEFQTTANRQQNEIEALTATLKAQATQIQKVSDQLRTSAPDLRTVANN